MKSTSRNDAIWPIFIAPPRSEERTVTISSASSAWRRARIAAALSGSRPTFVAKLVASLSEPGASAPVVFAARRRRPVGMRSSGGVRPHLGYASRKIVNERLRSGNGEHATIEGSSTES